MSGLSDVSSQRDTVTGRVRYRLLIGSGALAGALAAVATVAVASAARAADVSLEVAGKAVPLSAFAFWSIVGTVIGVVLAAVLRRRGRFVRTTLVATALSLLPPAFTADDVATGLVLVTTHLLAAAIVIPALARCLAGPAVPA
jgi:hypothetical protein